MVGFGHAGCLAPPAIRGKRRGGAAVRAARPFRPAGREAGAAVLFLHNHPSGDPTPSPEDRRVTERLRRAGEILGIAVLDHVVVGRDSYYSFADNGWR